LTFEPKLAAEVQKKIETDIRGEIIHTYKTTTTTNGKSATDVTGYAIRIPVTGKQGQDSRAALVVLLSQGGVDVAADQKVSLDQIPVGLDRIDQPLLPLDGQYNPFNRAGVPATGRGVNVYVVDSGIHVQHPELIDRARTAYSYACSDTDGSPINCDPPEGAPLGTDLVGDCSGHGTAVAGVIGGSTVGVATGVWIHSVRIADAQCLVAESGLAEGVKWLVNESNAGNLQTPAVVNISLSFEHGRGSDTPLEQCEDSMLCSQLERDIIKLIENGVTVVVSAGNRHVNACEFSPARVDGAITVGATWAGPHDNSDAEASFTNFGDCVDLFAPGVGIETAAANGGATLICPQGGRPIPPASENHHMICSGTTMSAAHVSGCAALHLQGEKEPDPQKVWIAIWESANHKDTGDAADPKFHEDTPDWGDGKLLGIASAEADPEEELPKRSLPINERHTNTPNILLQCGQPNL
jgi:subtilisin family serine protease